MLIERLPTIDLSTELSYQRGPAGLVTFSLTVRNRSPAAADGATVSAAEEKYRAAELPKLGCPLGQGQAKIPFSYVLYTWNVRLQVASHPSAASSAPPSVTR